MSLCLVSMHTYLIKHVMDKSPHIHNKARSMACPGTAGKGGFHPPLTFNKQHLMNVGPIDALAIPRLMYYGRIEGSSIQLCW